jgi:hypothetical protein
MRNARVLDATGRGVQLIPHDVPVWKGLTAAVSRR